MKEKSQGKFPSAKGGSVQRLVRLSPLNQWFYGRKRSLIYHAKIRCRIKRNQARILRNKALIFRLKLQQVFRFLRIRFQCFAYSYDVPPDFAWRFLFSHKPVNEIKMLDNVHKPNDHRPPRSDV